DVIVIAALAPPVGKPGKRLGDERRHRDRPNLARLRRGKAGFGVTGRDSYVPPREVDVPPPQGDELAPAPASAGGRQADGRRRLGRSRAHQSMDLLGREDVDLTPHPLRRLLDRANRVAGKLPDALSAAHDAVENREDLLARPVGHLLLSARWSGSRAS